MRELSEYINNDFKPFSSRETVADIQDFFAESTYSHFPVLDNGVYLGCISAVDAETFEMQKDITDYRYALEGFFVRTTMIWLDVLEIFARNNANVVPILDENNKYVGYYDITDVIKFLNETPFLKETGGIIVVEKPVSDYSMSQIAQIVESNNGKLLGLFVSEANAEKVQVTVKITLGSINEIIQSFRRYNYEIISEHHEDDYLNTLKERSEYLDKYLNM
ncbi:CBS domain-containing protein [Flavobacterium sp. IMCC34852]|uniref:CBS domain-containing protein n=1 Tax=Flavobacterium rivulicola TaxID=2732161 RepID=A0A7Y3R955_9FLAO|nr:CBS domain-containing protein [Flavobacterium sp. IMCC34852]NNT71826.1 CBS domain-containing protein [Flavobacterium sp. IMCC34852]